MYSEKFPTDNQTGTKTESTLLKKYLTCHEQTINALKEYQSLMHDRRILEKEINDIAEHPKQHARPDHMMLNRRWKIGKIQTEINKVSDEYADAKGKMQKAQTRITNLRCNNQ